MIDLVKYTFNEKIGRGRSYFTLIIREYDGCTERNHANSNQVDPNLLEIAHQNFAFMNNCNTYYYLSDYGGI